jgi:hypothetical protein
MRHQRIEKKKLPKLGPAQRRGSVLKQGEEGRRRTGRAPARVSYLVAAAVGGVVVAFLTGGRMGIGFAAGAGLAATAGFDRIAALFTGL